MPTEAVTGGILPFRQFVLKVHSRCDLACDHCYVYEHADQSWRGRPKVIDTNTVARAAERIAEHARRHALAGVRVILHGGEPLLAGAPRLGEIARVLRRAIDPVCRLDLRIHTNGVRLNEELCELFRAQQVMVGISVDGDRAANDLHRRFADGRSSYDQVIAAVNLLRRDRYRDNYAGLLATIDLRADPVAAYRALAALEPPAIDFLLPHGTWDNPPPGTGDGRTPYADWLAAVYEQWLADRRRPPVWIFESIIATTLGGPSRTEALGLEASDVLVIETDGMIEQADSIKVAYDGAPATGLSIFTDPLDAAAAHDAVRARQRGLAGLSETCRRCPVVSSCGGGLYAHRYRAGQGFDNPSVYCADLKQIITHVRASMRPAAPAGTARVAAGRSVRKQLEGQLIADHLDELAAGFGDGASIAHLIAAQRSERRLELRLLRRRAAESDYAFLAGWDLLCRVDRTHPDSVTEVLDHPYVRAWAEHCLRAAGPVAGAPLPADSAHLAAIAAAAAIRAGFLADVDVPVLAGYVCLPTLGRLRVGPAPTATVATDGSAFEVRASTGKWRVDLAAPRATQAWEPVRELHAGGQGKISVRLEDTDPFRNCHDWPAAPRLSDEAAARWQARFTDAWALIERAYPGYADAMAAGLSTLMPLVNDVPGRQISAAARQAFGAIGVALPSDGAALALLLIHEFQHVKLGAVLDLAELCAPHPGQLFYAPWRDDARPVEALLQGTYAHIGVTDYWRLRWPGLTGAAAIDAAERFARWRVLTAEAVERLSASGALTELGSRFVAGMRATVEPWLDEAVPAAAAQAAAHWIAHRRQAWQSAQER